MNTHQLGPEGLIIEAASNDGYLLQHFAAHNVPTLGIDPAKAPLLAARKKGINTLHTFLTLRLAQSLLEEGKRADVFFANKVLAHVADLRGFVDGVALLLKEHGVWLSKFPT